MRVYVESLLPCNADAAWAEVQKSTLLLEVIQPLAFVRPLEGETFPDEWTVGTTVRCRTVLLGLFPLGIRSIFFEKIDASTRVIQSREFDALVRTWDHKIEVDPVSASECRYSDEIEVEAGVLTPLVWLFAQVFYRHRQRRWQRVARRLNALLPCSRTS